MIDISDADWIASQTNIPLQTEKEVYHAIHLLQRMGLEHYGACHYKSWDTALGLWHAAQSCFPDDWILDAGGGPDSVILPGLAQLGYRNLLSINIDEEHIGYWHGIWSFPADITKTCLAARSQSFVVCQSVLEHGVDVYKFLDEMSRIIRPGGRLFVSIDYWERPINCDVHIFTPSEIYKTISYAARVGLRLSSKLRLTCREACVEWAGRHYTFLNLLLGRDV